MLSSAEKRISIIIPTFKPGLYIRDCLKSIGEQTLSPSFFETIIVLNGCNEPWLTQIEEMISEYLCGFEVKLIQTDASGVSNARNIAIDEAKGEYIAFIDDDDYISPKYLEELLKNSSAGCVALTDCVYFHDSENRYDDDNPHHRSFLRNRDKHKHTLFGCRVFFNGPYMKLLHRSIIGERRFNEKFRNGEDNLMMFGISDRISNLKFTTSDAIYYRRIRENSATTRNIRKREKFLTPLELMIEYCRYLVKNPFGYNLPFVLSRFAAEVKSIIIR